MATLTGRTPQDTYKDLLQVSNNNSGIDGTRRNISDGEGTNAPITVSTSAAAFTGILNASAATLQLGGDSILFSNIDWSGSDTLTGDLDVASGASIDFLSGATLTLATGSTLTVPNDFIPLSKVDLSDNDTLSGALAVTGSITLASGASLTASTGSSIVVGGSLDLASASTTFAANSVSLGTIAQIASASTLGRASGAGSGNVTALTAAQMQTILATARFESSNIAITQAGGASVAHGLGVRPNWITVILECVDAGGDGGFSQGDQIYVYGGLETVTASIRGVIVSADATNITYRFANSSTVFTVLNATTGASAGLTNGDWEMILVAGL